MTLLGHVEIVDGLIWRLVMPLFVDNTEANCLVAIIIHFVAIFCIPDP
jgi:hypothetical protein